MTKREIYVYIGQGLADGDASMEEYISGDGNEYVLKLTIRPYEANDADGYVDDADYDGPLMPFLPSE